MDSKNPWQLARGRETNDWKMDNKGDERMFEIIILIVIIADIL